MNKKIVVVFILWSFGLHISAQFLQESKIAGSFESNSRYYLNDELLNFSNPESAFATNNYFRLNYQYKFFEAGFQYENYLPPLLGYSQNLEGHRISQRYLTFRDKNVQITAGNFFEQYGNGLVLRAYEDRELGINTSLDGINARWELVNFITIKSFWGKQLGYKKNGNSVLVGGNLIFSISKFLFPKQNANFETEFSWVRKIEKTENELSRNQSIHETLFYFLISTAKQKIYFYTLLIL